jgi:hypothetical protein
MSGVVFPLVAEGQHLSSALVGLRPDVSGYSETAEEIYIPRCETLWHKQFRRVTYSISVFGTTGTAPTSWSLGARLEQFIPHTQQYGYALPTWAPLTAKQLEACVLEGEGFGGTTDPTAWGVIADSTTFPDFTTSGALPSGLTVPVGGTTSATLITTRVTKSLTITNQQLGTRVRFNPVITGGDSTTQILLSASAVGVR